MSRETVEWAKTVHLHNGPDGTTADDLIVLRGELAVMRGRLATALADLDAANERARVLAADLSRLAQENAAQASALHKANHTVDELRRQLYIEARADEGRAMRALRAVATQPGLMLIACDFSEGTISLAEAINRAQAMVEAGDTPPVKPPLTLTDRGGDGDGYCEYPEMVME